MEAKVRRTRIWDGGSPEAGFGEAVLPYSATVEFPSMSTSWLVVTNPAADRLRGGPVVVNASSVLIEGLWKEFVRDTGFSGKGLAGEVAEEFAKHVRAAGRAG